MKSRGGRICRPNHRPNAGRCIAASHGLEFQPQVQTDRHPRKSKFAVRPYFSSNMAEQLRFLGSLAGHKGWVTAIATSSENPDMILTASRGILFVSSSEIFDANFSE